MPRRPRVIFPKSRFTSSSGATTARSALSATMNIASTWSGSASMARGRAVGSTPMC